MNNLQLYSPIPAVSLITKEVITASSNKKIKDMNANIAAEQIKLCINRMVARVGQKIQDDKEFRILLTEEILKRRFNVLTPDEIEIAFRMGALEEFGEVKGINVRVCCTWLRKYMNEVKPSAVKEFRSCRLLAEVNTDKRTPEDKQKAMHDGLIRFIETENKMPLAWGYADVYEHLRRVGEAIPSEEEKNIIKEKVRGIIKQDAAERLQRKEMFEARNLVDFLNKPENFNARCKTEWVKEYLLKKYNL